MYSVSCGQFLSEKMANVLKSTLAAKGVATLPQDKSAMRVSNSRTLLMFTTSTLKYFKGVPPQGEAADCNSVTET